MKRLTLAAAVVVVASLVIFGAPSVAAAQEAAWAILEGFNEVPSISTKGNGVFRGVISADGTFIEFTLVYFDLESPVTAAHIHFGRPGVNGGIAAFLCGGDGKPACPSPPGTATGTVTASDIRTVQGIAAGELAELLRAIRRGATYVNVHTTGNPDGEIRGQINPGR